RERVPAGEAELLPQQEGRPGRARGHPAQLPGARPGLDQEIPLEGRIRALQAHLEPLRGLPDVARDLRRDDRGHRSRGLPPPRFSEASLVKELEENGIGRPSTYASIIGTIEARDYMEKREAKLYPTELGFLVTDLLVEHFQDIMNVEYTAALEAELDEIEEGKDNLLNTLNQFWKKFEKDLKKASKEMKDVKRMEEQTDEVCDKCGKPMVIKWGRYGKFLACSSYPECKNTRQLVGEDDGKLQVEQLTPIDEACPDCGKPLMWRRGRFGPFVA